MDRDDINFSVAVISSSVAILAIILLCILFFQRNTAYKQRDAAKNQLQQLQIQQTSCESKVHQQWDALIDNEMGLSPSIAYQYKGQEQTALDQCHPAN